MWWADGAMGVSQGEFNTGSFPILLIYFTYIYIYIYIYIVNQSLRFISSILIFFHFPFSLPEYWSLLVPNSLLSANSLFSLFILSTSFDSVFSF